MQQERKHILSHAGIYLVARGLPGIIAFLSIPLFTRLLSPADYGRYALIVAAAGLVNALLFQWLRLSLVRYLPAYHDDPARLKSTLASVSLLVILALGMIAGLMCLLPDHYNIRPVIAPCWILLAVQALFELCCEYTRAAMRPWSYMVLQIARSSATVGLGAVLVLMGISWRGPIIGTAVGMALAVVWIYPRDWAGVRLIIDKATLSKLCQYGIPLSITVALAIVISSSDRFLIAGYLGKDAAGLYSVAVDFTSQTLSLLMMVIQLAMFPIAVRAFEQQGREAAQEQMKVNASLLMAIGVPSVVGLALLAPGIANCVMGKEYRNTAAGIIPLIALGTFLAGFKAYHFDAAFQFAHRTIYQVWIVLIAAAVNVALNVVAIPWFGINGAAVASVLAYLLSIALTAYFGRKHFVLPFPGRACLQVVVAGTAMALLLFPLRRYHSPAAMVSQIASGATLYGLVLLGTNFMEMRTVLFHKVLARRNTSDAVSGANRNFAGGIGVSIAETN